ncbi:non-homologous end-joining DNA ligase [Bradyrhizobium murdochi]|uniref:non-homologous end-joining DNA ligase n=1 Tax=Bradyrhizobium murdochi TaxID=1038859 RepID=UPI00041F43BD|nr:non-homologous end-joining DNA ligase [Bradyrhizobium murdochi]
MTANFTNLDKIFWPKERYSKGDVIAYYEKIAPYLLPYVKDRAEALNRFPDGIKGNHFFQKDVDPKRLPRFVKSVSLRAKSAGKTVDYVVCNNKDTLLYLANLGCIEINPWSSRIAHPDKPDFMILDLDPSKGDVFDDVIAVAQTARQVLEGLRVKSYCKTSGKKGIHVLVPFGGKYTFAQVRHFAKLLAERIEAEIPALATTQHRIGKRRGKVYLDYMRNAIGQTAAAPYSLRPWPGATVSTPLDWREVRKGLNPRRFTIKTIFRRLKTRGDPLKPILKQRTDLHRIVRSLERDSKARASTSRS